MPELVNFLSAVVSNRIINAAVLAWAAAQLIKFVVALFTEKRVDLRSLLTSGGMPSSHSSTVTALSTSVLCTCGYSSPEFAIALILTIIVMYDASGVRRSAGQQARILNYMMDNWEKDTPEMFHRELKEMVGHTPWEVFAGAALGVVIGLLAALV